ncbi:MAG: septal ring lytic transglycosylase RlpA family protein [Pseudomonadota bacterium]
MGMMHLYRRSFGFLLLALLTACASVGPERRAAVTPNPHLKVGNPYTIKGITYVPKADPSYDAVGIASWYGPKFHGRLTANGEVFDMDRLTAAHKTLPLPSLVRVTNLENGRSEVLRLNDRGPYAGNRIIDLSRAAATRLGTREKGLAKVRVEYLGPADLDHAILRVGERENFAALRPNVQLVSVERTPPMPRQAPAPSYVAPAPAPPAEKLTHLVEAVAAPGLEPIPVAWSGPPAGNVEVVNLPPITDAPRQKTVPSSQYFVQLGVFQSAQNAKTAAMQLPRVIPVTIETVNFGATSRHHVRLGPYSHEFAAQEARKTAQNAGFSDAHIVEQGQKD